MLNSIGPLQANMLRNIHIPTITFKKTKNTRDQPKLTLTAYFCCIKYTDIIILHLQ